MHKNTLPQSSESLYRLFIETLDVDPVGDFSLLRATQFELSAAIIESAAKERAFPNVALGTGLASHLLLETTCRPGIWVAIGQSNRHLLKQISDGLAGEVTVSFPDGFSNAYVIMNGPTPLGLSRLGEANLCAGLKNLNIPIVG